MKDKRIAAICAIIGGIFGAHKFYLEKFGQGILYFLFSWTFIPAIIGFIEGINYLCMSEELFNYKYNQARRMNNEQNESAFFIAPFIFKS